MSSITPMMLLICLEEFSIWPMAPMALVTTSPERSAPVLVLATRLPASAARLELSLTV
ncbi:hypothetical protein D3C87_2019630 [compost metagenome]